MKTKYPVLNRLAKEYLDKIDSISDERENDDGFWIYLKTPFCNREMEPHGGLHLIHESSPSACIPYLKAADKCNCTNCSHPYALCAYFSNGECVKNYACNCTRFK